MQEFQVAIYNQNDRSFLTSFVHPLTKRKVRQNFLSQKEAEAYVHAVESKYKKRQVENYAQLNIEELIVHFTNERPNNPFTFRKLHLIDFGETFGRFRIDEITADALKLWLDQVQNENGLKDITMRGLKCEIDTLFAFLERKEVISESPLSRIYYAKFAPPLKARNILSENQIETLLGAIKGYAPGYLYPIVKLIAETAAKVSEVIGLTWNDLDLENKFVQFNGSEKSQARRLKVSDELSDLLLKRKQHAKSHLVFQTYYKEPFTRMKLMRAINEFRNKKLYVGEWVPSDLRHSFAVNFLAKGGDIRELQKILGHNNVFDTKRLYGEVASERIVQDVTNPFG